MFPHPFSRVVRLLPLVLAGAVQAAPPSPLEIGHLVSEDLLARPDFMRYGADGLHYAEACTALGALRFAQLADDEALHSRIRQRFAALHDPETDLISPKAHVDFSVIGIIPLQVYLATGDQRERRLGLRFADRQWEDPRDDGLTRETCWWIDDMYMVGALQMQAFRTTGKTVYAERAARFLKAYLEKLQQPNGLFFHGPEAPFHWGRGNGWVAAAMAEVLKSLPTEVPEHTPILRAYQHMMETLLRFQTDNGLWRQLIDDAEAWEETSCTAMFAFAMEVGVQKGWLPAETYRPAVDRAWNALTERIDDAGRLHDICVGTGQSDERQYYLDRPRHRGDFHGQAPVLWLARELLARTPPRS